MKKRIIKVIQIYSFAILFVFGIGLVAIFSNTDINTLQLVEEANASMILTESDCEGYQQAVTSETRLVVMCNCSTQRAEGEIVCGDTPPDDK